MGKARPVVPRPNFTQNVMRAIRQEAQTSSPWQRLADWLVAWQRPVAGLTAAVIMLTGVAVLLNHGDQHSQVVVASVPAIISDTEMATLADVDVSVPLDGLDHMDALVAMQDTTALTDTEIQFLLY